VAPEIIAETKAINSTNPLKKDEFETTGTNVIDQIIIKTIFAVIVATTIDIDTLNMF